MSRVLFELSGAFLLPFIVYAGFLIWREKHPRAAKAILRKKPLQLQVLLGLILVAAALLYAGLADEPHRGGYVPAIFKDGKLVPGQVK